MKSELHDFILWENAIPEYEKIIKEMKISFEIKRVYKISWLKEKFENNLKRFYGVTLANPAEKKSLCGNGSFLFIIVEDKNPIHEKRKTSLGTQMVNSNIYDKKMKLRKILGSGFLIHSSIHEKEANHDFMMLLGKNVDQLRTELTNSDNDEIIEVESGLFGEVWDNPEQVFEMLNATTNYVVLRNFENIPEDLVSEEHKDVDILTDEQFQIPYNLNMQKTNSNNIGFLPYIIIKNKKIKFDIKFVGDNYYDEKWSKEILKRRILSKNKIFVPSDKDYFYSLLYHMIIHKKKLNSKYCKILTNIGPEVTKNLSKNDFSDLKILKENLNRFMENYDYNYTDSIKYKISHNEMTRLIKVSKFAIKHEGWNFFLRAVKYKILSRSKK